MITEFRKKKPDGSPVNPLLVVTTSVALCRAITTLLRENTTKPQKVQCLYGENQHNVFNTKFIEDPNADDIIQQCDAICMTHCAPFGLSLTRHFRMLVVAYPNSFVTHRTEYQFTRRLRLRPELYPFIIAYIEKGASNSG
jgi:hypothetical protein